MDFVARCVTISAKKVSTNGSSTSRTQFSRKYYQPIQINDIQPVYKAFFFKNNWNIKKEVNNMGKKLAISPVISVDQRGKHTHRPHAIPREVIDCTTYLYVPSR